ncbi:LysE family translocator [Vibrio sp. DNF-1]|nr:LysE family translocator [Vibrio salinus]
MSNAAIVGHKGALKVIIGTAIGIFVHSVLVGMGISRLIVQNHTVFNVLQICGIAFLGWLGIKLLLAGLKPAKEVQLKAKLVGVRDAFFLNVFNVKAFVLYVTVVPLFAGKSLDSYLGLSSIHIAIMAVWTYFCCYLFCVANRKFTISVVAKVVNLLGGISLLYIACHTAFSLAG